MGSRVPTCGRGTAAPNPRTFVSRYLLDTTVLIDFSKRREPALSLVRQLLARREELGVCPINVGEFFTGLTSADRLVWDEFLDLLYYWPISFAAARQAGIWRYDFARQGLALSMTDALVAAVALLENAILLTGNVKDFPMPEIRVVAIANLLIDE